MPGKGKERGMWDSPGWDIVRTPFGGRVVPKGHGWREAAKWELWRLAVSAAELAAAALAALLAWHYVIPHGPGR